MSVAWSSQLEAYVGQHMYQGMKIAAKSASVLLYCVES